MTTANAHSTPSNRGFQVDSLFHMLETPDMSFLVLLVVLLAERLLQPYLQLRQAYWFERWLELHQSLPIAQGLRYGVLGLAGLLLPPLLLAAVPLWLFGGALFGIPGLLFTALILLYSLGPADLSMQVDALSAAVKAENEAGARAVVAELPDEPLDTLSDDFWHKAALAVLLAAHRRIFGVIFWFLILGPLGALAYRLVRETRLQALAQSRPGINETSARLLYLLDWLPARLLAGLFALAGCFEPSVQGWKHCTLEDSELGGPSLVVCSGRGALQMGAEIARLDAQDTMDAGPAKAAMSLVWRSLVILVLLAGLVAITSWLS